MPNNEQEPIKENTNDEIFRLTQLNEELKDWEFTWWKFCIAMIIGICMYYIVIWYKNDFTMQKIIFSGIHVLISIFLTIVFYCLITFVNKAAIKTNIENTNLYLIRQGAISGLKEKDDENFFTKLVQINFKYIDQYYLQTQKQANKSFFLSLFSAIIGLGIISVGIFLMFISVDDNFAPAYVTIGTGALSEFISATFFYLYNKTIIKMADYHQKLVITQNISLALKIVEDMDGQDKIDAQKGLITQLVDKVNFHLTQSSDKN